MTCPICTKPPTGEADHRWCLVELFKTNKIQKVSDWEAMCKPKTIIKGRVKIRLPPS
jgi:hypothetical protein